MIFVAILFGLLPSFLLVVLGGVIRNRLSVNAWEGLDRLNFEILFPALLFVAASGRPVAFSQVVTIAPLAWAILVLGAACGYLARGLGPERFTDFAGGWQVSWRFNTALGFIAIAALDQDAAIFAVVVGMAVPMANVFAVSALSRGGGIGFFQTIKKVLLNPFLIASLSGALVALSGLEIPALAMAPLVLLSQAAIPVALISIGATMNWGALARLDRFSGLINATKLLILPAAVCLVALAVSAKGPLVQTLIVFAALPTASAAHVLASGFGADRKLVATLIAQTTLLSAASLPLWILVAKLGF